MRGLWVALVALLLVGCESLQHDSVQWLEKTGQALRNWGAAERQLAYDREVQQLFAQPWIDPLTRYLEQYRSDESRAEHLQRVLRERDARCAAIAERYAQRPLTASTLEQYRVGYRYSCPRQVQAFAARLAASHPRPADKPPPAGSGPIPAAPAAELSARSLWSEQLNDCYLLTTIRNFNEARDACQVPAEQGDLRAQYNMALIAQALEQYTEAVHWAHLAAPRSAEARYLLGALHADGLGVARDDEQALHWYREAAEMGSARAQFQTGRFLATGRAGAADPAAALAWYQRAAAQGNAEAQLALGHALLRGEGTQIDPVQGRYWLLRAARQGQAQAQLQLGALTEAAGQPADALVWYELAAGNGLDEAQVQAQRLRMQLPASAVSDAQGRVRRLLEGGR